MLKSYNKLGYSPLLGNPTRKEIPNRILLALGRRFHSQSAFRSWSPAFVALKTFIAHCVGVAIVAVVVVDVVVIVIS